MPAESGNLAGFNQLHTAPTTTTAVSYVFDPVQAMAQALPHSGRDLKSGGTFLKDVGQFDSVMSTG